MSVILENERGRDYVPLFVVPEGHPSQSALVADERDVVMAQSLGAEWVKGCRHMRAGPGTTTDEMDVLEQTFASQEARLRAAKAFDDQVGDLAPDGEMVAAAFNEIGKDVPPSSGMRFYLHSTREAASPYSSAELRRTARDSAIVLRLDRDRGSPNYLTYYVTDTGDAERLGWWRTPAAEQVATEDRRLRSLEDRVLVEAANTEAGVDARLRRPLAVPKPDRDPEGFSLAGQAVRKLGRDADRLKRIVDVTRRAVEAARREEEAAAREGRQLLPQHKAHAVMLMRGVRVGEHVLRERTLSGGHRRPPERSETERSETERPETERPELERERPEPAKDDECGVERRRPRVAERD